MHGRRIPFTIGGLMTLVLVATLGFSGIGLGSVGVRDQPIRMKNKPPRDVSVREREALDQFNMAHLLREVAEYTLTEFLQDTEAIDLREVYGSALTDKIRAARRARPPLKAQEREARRASAIESLKRDIIQARADETAKRAVYEKEQRIGLIPDIVFPGPPPLTP